MELCVYCSNPRGNKISCCKEVHFEEVPDCPNCGAEGMTYRQHFNGDAAVPECNYWACDECWHEWGYE